MANYHFKKYITGLHHVGSYQVAGLPYITGSTTHAAEQEVKYEFNNVSNRVIVMNHANQTVRVHFTATGSQAIGVVGGLHYVELDSDEDSIDLSIKCKEVYISTPSTNSGNASYRIVAELTAIPAAEMVNLTGSGLTD